jgi:aryl-alcohol dehydrogenase-like predicted oxidoreductase
MIKYCKFAGIGLIPYSVLGYGQLARPLGAGSTKRAEYSSGKPWVGRPQECEDEIVRRVEKVAKDKGWLMSQVALAWAGDVVTSPLIGVSSVRAGARREKEEADQAVQAKRLEEAIIPGFKLTEEERKYLEEPYVLVACCSSHRVSDTPLRYCPMPIKGHQ